MSISKGLRKVSSLMHARYVLAVNPLPVRVLHHHSVVVDKGEIIDVLATAEAQAKYTSDDTTAFDTHVIMPGLVNAHSHSAMTLLRGYADDLPLMKWLQEHIWPVEGQFALELFCREGTELACAEMIKSGTTSFNDMYLFPEDSAPVVDKCGMRANIGCPIMMFPTSWAKSPQEYTAKTQSMIDAYKDHARINISIAPHAPYTTTDEQLTGIKHQSEASGVRVHMHLHEQQGEIDDALKATNERPIQRLMDLGLLNDKFLAVHMTCLTDEEIALIAKQGVSVAHCPESNMKLASGACPTHKLITAGVNVAIGTDGCASNNDLDMFGEMRTAALLGKLTAMNAAALDAGTALRMATINGANALGLGDTSGSIEIGKRADIIAVDLDYLECAPLYDVMSHLVYSAGKSNVTDVWVDGKRLLRDRALTTMDERDIITRSRSWGEKIAKWKAEKPNSS